MSENKWKITKRWLDDVQKDLFKVVITSWRVSWKLSRLKDCNEGGSGIRWTYDELMMIEQTISMHFTGFLFNRLLELNNPWTW